MNIEDILNGTKYNLTQFSQKNITSLLERVIEKNNKGKPALYVECLIRKKLIMLKPEEIIRQLYIDKLNKQYGYPLNRMAVEYIVSFGREKKKADIVIFDKDRKTTPYIIVELKKPKLKDGKEQLKSYCNATGAPIGVWTNGEQISYYNRKDPNYFEDIPNIPSEHESLADILTERWTIDTLIQKDKLVQERKSLKDLILEMEDEVLANAGVDVFEEVFKLIFTKLFDELQSGRDKKRVLQFRNYGYTETQLKGKIQDLFEQAKNKWEGIFDEGSKIELTGSHLSVCVSSLQDVKLFNSNLDIIDDAFEYLMSKSQKGEKGQYFTPRYVIEMCVRMLNLIAGDGKTNVLHLNTLDYERWDEVTKEEQWRDTYNEGWKKLKKLRSIKNSNQFFNFDILMANPPFAGDIKESKMISCYELGKNAKGKMQSKVGRDILFIERNLNFLKPGGRMAVVLPQGRFNNSNDKYIRDYIAKYCRILAVVGLHGNVFKPHTGTKTSVLFVQKWDNELCPYKEDYPIFFATMQEPSKDNSGEKMYVTKDGKPVLDTHGHLIVKHDLYNHDGLTQDGIAEAFIEFAKKEKLSFF